MTIREVVGGPVITRTSTQTFCTRRRWLTPELGRTDSSVTSRLATMIALGLLLEVRKGFERTPRSCLEFLLLIVVPVSPGLLALVCGERGRAFLVKEGRKCSSLSAAFET